jgi:hypothetical protein
MSTHGPSRGWKVVSVAAPGILFAVLGSGALSRSVEGFAWALVAYVVVLIGLVASEFRRWISRGYFARGELLPVLVAGGFAETLLAGALLADALVERHPVALVVSVPVLLVLMIACDLMIAARIGGSESPPPIELAPENGEPEEHVPEDGDEPQGDWLQDVDQLATSTDVSADESNAPDADHASAHRWSLRIVLDLGNLAVRGAEWIAPVAVVGVLGVCAVVAIGGVPKGATTSTTSGAQQNAGKAASGVKTGSSSTKGGTGGAGGHGGSGDGGGSTTPPRWNGPCTEEMRGEVSKLAFERMISFFESAHLEVGVEGCIEDLEGHPYPKDYYVTAIGVEQPTHEPVSFAVESERCGGALVLNEARKALEEVMAQAGPVCGVDSYPRYYVGEADYYFLRSARGVYIIFRRTQANEYEVMPPGLVRTWYHAMLAVNTWLSPSPPRRIGDHMLSYEMWSPRNTKRAEVTVTFNEQTGVGSYPGQSYGPDPKFEPLLSRLLKLPEEG